MVELPTDGMIKIFFTLDNETESLWGQAVAHNHFTIINSPFYAKGISFLDVVSAVPRERDQGFDFVSVVSRGGHSTYRIFMPELTDLCKRWWEKLEKEGCSYESATVSNGILFSVDVPNTTDIYRVYQILSDAENEGVWGFEEAHVGHRLND